MESYGATDAQIDKSQFSNNLKLNGKFCKNMFAKLHSVWVFQAFKIVKEV
jgi:hypothetical protein